MKPTASATMAIFEPMPTPSHNSTSGDQATTGTELIAMAVGSTGPRNSGTTTSSPARPMPTTRADRVAGQGLLRRDPAGGEQHGAVLPGGGDDVADRGQRIGGQREAARDGLPQDQQQDAAEDAAQRGAMLVPGDRAGRSPFLAGRALHCSAPQNTIRRSASATSA